jgi:hypothetical protein
MPELRFLIGERQAGCFLEFAGTTKPQGSSVCRLFFCAQDSEADTVFEGRPVQCVGSSMTIVEGTDDDLDISGTLDANDAHDANGKPSQVVIETTIRVPKSTFQQLLQTSLAETLIWVHVSTAVPAREEHGFATTNLTKARFSLIPKPQAPIAPVRDYSPILERLFWAVVILGIAMLWRLR